jgi:hypothetical protein
MLFGTYNIDKSLFEHYIYDIKIWKQSDPSEALITTQYKRIADSV